MSCANVYCKQSRTRCEYVAGSKNPGAKHGLTTLKPETRSGLLSVLGENYLLLALYSRHYGLV